MLPVESNTKHPVVPESRDEQLDIFSSLSILGQGSLSQRYRPNSIRPEYSSQSQIHFTLPAPISVLEGLGSAVAAPQPGPLGQDELQLRGGSARDEGADQSQRVLVEVSLGGKY